MYGLTAVQIYRERWRVQWKQNHLNTGFILRLVLMMNDLNSGTEKISAQTAATFSRRLK